MTTTKTTKLNAPYASVKPFSEILKKIRDLQFSKIDNDILINLGYNKFNASSAITTLRFLDIIDDNGSVKENYRKIKPDSKYKTELRRIIETAYKGLFTILGENLSIKTKKIIKDAIILPGAYPDTAKKSTGKVATLFIWLCEQAGIEIGAEPIDTKKPKRGKLKKPSGKKEETLNKAEDASKERYSLTQKLGNIILGINITPGMSEEDILNLLRNVKKAIKQLENEGDEK